MLMGVAAPAHAQSLCLVNNATSAPCVLSTNFDTAQITPSGSISVASGSFRGAVTVQPGINSGFILNTGTLTSFNLFHGIKLDFHAQVGDVENLGLIQSFGGGDAIVVESGARITTFQNYVQGVINSDQAAGVGILGTIDTLINRGSLLGATGIYMGSTGLIGNLINEGSIISSSAYGLWNNGRVLVLNNAGTLSGSSGIYQAQGASMDILINTGTIRGDGHNGAGIYFEPDAVSPVRITELINDGGTIEGTGPGAKGIYMGGQGDSSIGTLLTSGTIRGDQYAIYAHDNLSVIGELGIYGNDTARFHGEVYARSATMRVRQNATYTFRTTDVFTVDAFNNEGTVRFENNPNPYNFFTFTNGFTNNGTVELAAGQTVSIAGTFYQGAAGKLRFSLTNNTDHGRLIVSDVVSLPSNAQFEVNVADPNFAFTTPQLSDVVVVQNPNLLLWDGTGTVADNSALFDFQAVLDGDTIDLRLVAAGGSGGGGGGGGSAGGTVAAVNGASRTGARGVAQAIDRLAALYASNGTTGNAQLDAFIQRSGSLSTQQALAQAAESATLAPSLQGSLMGNLASFGQVIDIRTAGLAQGVSAGDLIADTRLWAKPFGSWGRQKDRDGASGFQSSSTGIVLGADGELARGYRLGAMLGYARSRADANSGLVNGQVDSFTLGLYGAADLGGRRSLSWRAGYSQHDNRSNRSIPLAGSTAMGDFHARGWSFGTALEQSHDMGGFTVTPSVRLDVDSIRNKAYAETGAGGLNLSVDGSRTQRSVLSLHARSDYALSEGSTLSAELGLGHDFSAKQRSITSSFVGGGGVFSTPGIQPASTVMRAGLGYTSQFSSGVEIRARLDLEGRPSGERLASASVTARWSF